MKKKTPIEIVYEPIRWLYSDEKKVLAAMVLNSTNIKDGNSDLGLWKVH
jgi:hypothetical protein